MPTFNIDKINLCLLPTPLHRLKNLSEELGIDLWIKRDDLTGFAGGGNKGRKLEYLMADVLARQAQAVVTCGALQSNFIRQLAAACAMFNIRCLAAVMDLPFDKAVGKPKGVPLGNKGGNLVLDQLFNAELHEMPNGDWQDLYDAAEGIAQDLERQNVKVFRIPIGGSSAQGGYAFFQAGEEVKAQAPRFDFIITATSSGSTQAGLQQSFKGTASKLIGIAADTEPDLVEDVLRVSRGLTDLLNMEAQTEGGFDIRSDWAPPGYGIPNESGRQAIEMMAKTEGILLDPIYTGKAFAGLLELAKTGEIKGRTLFWHTGGVPSLFAY